MLLLVRSTLEVCAGGRGAGRDLLTRWVVLVTLVFFDGVVPLLAYVVPLLPALVFAVKWRLVSPDSKLHLTVHALLAATYLSYDLAGTAWTLLGWGGVATASAAVRFASRLLAPLSPDQLRWAGAVVQRNIACIKLPKQRSSRRSRHLAAPATAPRRASLGHLLTA